MGGGLWDLQKSLDVPLPVTHKTFLINNSFDSSQTVINL